MSRDRAVAAALRDAEVVAAALRDAARAAEPPSPAAERRGYKTRAHPSSGTDGFHPVDGIRHPRPCRCRWFVFLVVAAVAGCGGGGPAKVPVRGQVFRNDKPLEYGNVMFQPVSGGPMARGQIQPDGTFVLTTTKEGDGVVPGRCRVRITAFESQRAEAADPMKEEMPMGQSAVAEKYQSFGTSQIVIEVTSDMEQPVIIRLD